MMETTDTHFHSFWQHGLLGVVTSMDFLSRGRKISELSKLSIEIFRTICLQVDFRTCPLLRPQRPLPLLDRQFVARVPQHNVLLHRLRTARQRANVGSSQASICTDVFDSTLDFLSSLDSSAHYQCSSKTNEERGLCNDQRQRARTHQDVILLSHCA